MPTSTHIATTHDQTADGAKPQNRPIWAVIKPDIWRHVARLYPELDSPTLLRLGRRHRTQGPGPDAPRQVPDQPADHAEPPRAYGISEDRLNPDQHAAEGATTIAFCVALATALLASLAWLVLPIPGPSYWLGPAFIAFFAVIVLLEPLHLVAPPLNRRLRRWCESIGANTARRRGIRKGQFDEPQPDTTTPEQIALWQELLDRRTRPLSWLIAGAKSPGSIRMAFAMSLFVMLVVPAAIHATSPHSIPVILVMQAVPVIPLVWFACIAIGIIRLMHDRRRLRRLLAESRCVYCDYPAGVELTQLTGRVCTECGSTFPLPPAELIPDDE